jgi:hypothetical protein
MNKKEISEIKKIFTPANCSLTRICSCYVDAEKNKRAELKEAFLSLPDEEAFKYFNIFRGALSGTVAKNLINLDSPSDYLLRLRDSQLRDDDLINEFYDKIIESYDYGENYYIVLVHGIYDVPGKAQDGTVIDDASDYVYEFIQCAICPVKLTKGALSYNTDKNAIENRKRDWIVEAPETGFLYPAFNDRQTDIYGTLYYTKKADQLHDKLIDGLFGTCIPMSAEDQKSTFGAMVEETLEEECDFTTVKSIYEDLIERIEESDSNVVELDFKHMEQMFNEYGASTEKIDELKARFENSPYKLIASNVVNTKTFEIKTEGLEIKVKPDYTSRVECRMIDGRPCIVMAVSDHLEVNGITARPFPMCAEEDEQ